MHYKWQFKLYHSQPSKTPNLHCDGGAESSCSSCRSLLKNKKVCCSQYPLVRLIVNKSRLKKTIFSQLFTYFLQISINLTLKKSHKKTCNEVYTFHLFLNLPNFQDFALFTIFTQSTKCVNLTNSSLSSFFLFDIDIVYYFYDQRLFGIETTTSMLHIRCGKIKKKTEAL